ncbi:M3 family metallopeptidase [Microlunatus ginsengisoli]|uniref:M3 family metallopeptidase n=1 Tax=Microlunatus ginsengisoli TaxID=363863 RepID=A0ABP6ZFB8_9ACTN
MSADVRPSNPFAEPSPLPYGLPPFAECTPAALEAAFEQGMAAQLAEVEAIVATPGPATFDNTLEALERSGRLLRRAQRVFWLLTSADTNPELEALETAYAPRFAVHADEIMLNRRLFDRIDALYAERAQLGLDAEQVRLLERYHTDLSRAGAALDEPSRLHLADLNRQIAECSTAFGTNLLADTNDSAVLFSDVAELDGLGPDAIGAAAEAARQRGLDGYLITLVLPTHQPALESLHEPASRRRLLAAAQSRGSRGNAYDNRDLIRRLAVLRAERAELLGYRSHSDYVLADRTAKDNASVDDMLHRIIPAATANASREAAELAAAKRADGDDAPFEASDWAYYAARVRRDRYAFDASAIRPYVELERVLTDGVFAAATLLYGLGFVVRDDLAGYHPDVVVYEVFDADGSGLGLFVADFFTRDGKRGGAWSESLVPQSRLLGERPVVANNLNVPKPPAGSPALLTQDEVATLFHEFGHALHALFSDVSYPRLSGTAVARDFVEFPSQVNEMWLSWPAVLDGYARHVDDGSPLPPELAAALRNPPTFNQGVETVASLAATWIDLAWHRLTRAEAAAVTDVAEFEARALAEAGLDLDAIPPRYRGPYFNHVFASGYSAGYYSYLWSEVLDADTVEWFREHAGDLRAAGQAFRDALLSRGGTAPELELYDAFRGRPARIEPLLARRGLC